MFRRICSYLPIFTLLCPSWSWAAIAIDATSEGGGQTATVTVSHTVSGSDRYLICHAFLYGNSQSVSTWTWNTSENLTSITSAVNGSAKVEMWGIKAPSTGTHNWVLTATGSTDIVAGCGSYTGVNQTTPLGTASQGAGASTAPSVTVSSAAGELVVDGLAVDSPSGSGYTLGAGQTERWSHTVAGGNFNNPEAVSSTEAGAASVTMSYTLNNSWNWALAAVPLLEATGGGGSVSRGMLLGVYP